MALYLQPHVTEDPRTFCLVRGKKGKKHLTRPWKCSPSHGVLTLTTWGTIYHDPYKRIVHVSSDFRTDTGMMRVDEWLRTMTSELVLPSGSLKPLGCNTERASAGVGCGFPKFVRPGPPVTLIRLGRRRSCYGRSACGPDEGYLPGMDGLVLTYSSHRRNTYRHRAVAVQKFASKVQRGHGTFTSYIYALII